jgi:ABC-type antimicrobial peptide transport system permease subunit
MINSYFKIAFRNIRRYSTHSILNISGMAIAMACAILILLWVQNELSFDRFHKNADCIYRVLENRYSEGGDIQPTALTPNALSPALKEEYPEIIRSTRYEGRAFPIQKNDDYIVEVGAVVDKDFLEMFNIKFVFGDIKSAFNGPHDLVITEEMAHKYFGNEDPLGKTLKSMNFIFTITGVVKSLPQNSHIQFDFLVPFKLYTEFGADLNAWGFNATYSYIELHDGTDSKFVENKIKGILQRKVKDSRADLFLQNIKKIHLYSYAKYNADISGHGDITYIRILSIIAVFILIIACINFMNLSTAQSARRAKEIGVRKVAGANKGKIFLQFIGESMLIVIVAHILAMILVELFLPVFNNLIRNYQSSDLLMMNFNNHISKQVDVNYQSAGLYIGLISIVLFCGFLAGSYPALYLSSLKPLDTMKGIVNKNPDKALLRRFLVIFQFSLSVLLIICTIIVGKQLKYMQDINLGFNKDNIGYFQFGMGFPREVFKKDLSSNQDILSVTIAENPFSGIGTNISEDFNWEGKHTGEKVLFSTIHCDEDYAKTFQLGIKAGRFFSSEFSTDNTAIVINEKAAEILGFKDPVGGIVSSKDGSKFRIIGVVKDFHFKSLRSKIEPLIMFMPRESFNCFIRMKSDKISSTIDFVRKTFKSYNQNIPLVFKFFEDDYNNLYWREQRMSKIFGYFSFLAIIISTLGLIGLSLFMTELRTKETGIRKINGAKSFEIFFLLSKEYLLWVLISIIIASPIAWHVMNKWLQKFAYRIEIRWWVFALTGAIALIVALLTVGFQSYRAASRNPVEALRYE